MDLPGPLADRGPSSATPGRRRAARELDRGAGAELSVARRDAPARSLADQRRDDDAALGLLALAERLEPGAVLELVVDDLALGRASSARARSPCRSRAPARRRGRPGARPSRGAARGSRRRRPRPACARRGRGRRPGSRAAARRRSSARGGRSAARASSPSTRAAISSSSRRRRPRLEVERVDDLVEQRPRPARPARREASPRSLIAASSSFAAAAGAVSPSPSPPPGVGGVGIGMILCTTTCCPRLQRLVVIQ